ncbi:MAG: succinate dehydrogenase cytochrome b subunit [Candidatus Zixiibacteriota bacterium]
MTTSSIGKKLFVAVTGAALLLFAFGHMVGNLQVFIGQDQINKYAHALQSLGAMLWVIRVGLIVMAVLHIFFAAKLKLENWKARPVGYAFKDTVQAGLASRTMIWSGLLIFCFIAYHLLHFTFMSIHPEYKGLTAMLDGKEVHDVYSMIIYGFKQPLISALYVVMMFLLAYHLSHGIKSMFQTLGWNNERYEPKLNKLAIAVATIIFLGYISIPVAIMSGLIKLPGGMVI